MTAWPRPLADPIAVILRARGLRRFRSKRVRRLQSGSETFRSSDLGSRPAKRAVVGTRLYPRYATEDDATVFDLIVALAGCSGDNHWPAQAAIELNNDANVRVRHTARGR